MRKAFTLIELLAFFLISAVLLLTLSPLMHRLFRDVPGSHRLLETHAQLQGIVAHMQYDIDRAVDLPSAFGDQAADLALHQAKELQVGDGVLASVVENVPK